MRSQKTTRGLSKFVWCFLIREDFIIGAMNYTDFFLVTLYVVFMKINLMFVAL